MPIKLTNSKAAASALLEAFKSGTECDKAFEAFTQAVADDVTAEYRAAVASNDSRILAERGFRALTSEETEYYKKVIEALRDPMPKQAFAAIPDKAMPITIIENVMKDIAADHPLIAAVKPQATSYLTQWVNNGHGDERFAWGAITSAITEEITSSFNVVDLKQGKLSGFAAISIDMLELGPVWLDGYIRACIGEAYACGLEYGIIMGKGVLGEPVGLVRSVAADVEVNASTGYPMKQAQAVTEITPAKFGELCAQLAVTEAGKQKSVNMLNGGLSIIVNNTTYLTKLMPATRVRATNGLYEDAFPVPCEVIISNAVPANKAILCLLDEYGLFVGGNRGIQFSDEFRFLEDQRVFKMVAYASGKAEDESSAILLNIENLAPAVVTVKNIPAA